MHRKDFATVTLKKKIPQFKIQKFYIGERLKSGDRLKHRACLEVSIQHSLTLPPVSYYILALF